MVNIGNHQETTIHIQFFRKFSMADECGNVLNSENIRSDMMTKLLSYMIYHRKKSIGVQELSEALWAEEDCENPAGALKNLMYRLRRILKSIWSDQQLILTGMSAYQWNPEIRVIIDIECFNDNIKRMETEKDTNEKIRMGLEALSLYQGMFLPEMSGEYWVMSLSTYYHSLYLTTAKKLLKLLEGERKYTLIEEVCQKAIRIDTLDEAIHCYFIKAMIAENKQNLALAHYQDVKELLYQNLGVSPSKELLETYEELMKQQHEQERNIGVIQADLKEESIVTGAFLCEYGVFKKIYSLEERNCRRTGISIHLGLISLYPSYNIKEFDKIYNKLIKKGMKILQDVLTTCLRSSDAVCRYSMNQYLVMLPSCPYESAVMVIERIENRFYKLDSRTKLILQYSLNKIDAE